MGVDLQVFVSKALTESENSTCSQTCCDRCRAETISDNSGQNGHVLLRSLLKADPNGDDGNGGKQPRRDRPKYSGEALLEVIRLLAKMDPEERTALIGLLKALG